MYHKISGIDTNTDGGVSAIELDSHADSPVVGKHARIIRHTGNEVKVSGFSNELGNPLTAEIVDAAFCYDCEYTGETYLMIIRNAIYLRKMITNLIPPFMMRMAGLEINECPKFLAKRPTLEHHSIYFPDEELRIPLKIHGIISYLPVRSPSEDELTSLSTMLELTPQSSAWDPHDETYQVQEDSMLSFEGEIKDPPKRKFIVSSVISRAVDPVTFGEDVTRRASEMGISQHRIYSIKTANGSKSLIKPADLAKVWNIGLETARRTLQVTTRLCPRNVEDITLNRRYSVNDRMLRYKRLDAPIFMDTMYASKRAGKSFRGFTCVQVFASEFGWVRADPMRLESDLHKSLKSLFKEVGVPSKLIADGARAQVQGRSRQICEEAHCKLIELEKNTPASNRAERYIQLLKNGSKTDMIRANSPMIFWDFCIERRARIENALAKNNHLLKGSVPHSVISGEVTDISNICNFGWNEWIKFRKPGEKYPYPTEWLGRCLGPAHNKGNEMSQSVLTEAGEVLPIQTLRKLTEAEVNNPNEKERRKRMDEFVFSKYGDARNVPDNWVARRRRPGDPVQHEDNELETTPNEAYQDNSGDSISQPEVDSIPDLDLFINAEVLLPQDGEHMRAARVIGRATNEDGLPIGEYNVNPVLNSRVYDVMFPDGAIHQYSANVIAENLYNQVDEEGFRYTIMDEIVDHKRGPSALDEEDAFTVDKYGRRKRKLTTQGWDFLVNWKDGTQSWVPLRDLKESNPIETAEYACMRGIDKEPAFIWWVGYTIKKCDRMIAVINAKLRKKTHKYGIEIPRSVEHAYRIDKEDGSTFWRNAIKKEMTNVIVAFDILEHNEEPPRNLKELGVHLVFDVKMDLTRKARLVADGHKTADPVGSTYAGVVSRESVRIAFTYAALNNLNVWAADIQNAYLTAPTSEGFYITCGAEFGSEAIGKKAIVKRALYGTKSAGRDFRNHLRDCMDHMGYMSCKADPDLWMRISKRSDGRDYYEYILLYVDDCLCVSEFPSESLKKLDKYFPLKAGSVGEPKLYLGAKLSRVDLPNGVNAWA